MAGSKDLDRHDPAFQIFPGPSGLLYTMKNPELVEDRIQINKTYPP